MQKIFCLIFSLLNFCLFSQTGLFINGDDASLRVDSTSFLSVDGDFYNMNCNSTAYVRFNGSLYLSGSFVNNDSLKFSATSGSGNSKKARIIFRTASFSPTNTIGAIIGGSSTPTFWEVELDKNLGNQITLFNNVNCLDTLTFKTGLLYMNGYKWKMIDPVGATSVINHPYIKNEIHSSQFKTTALNDTGLVIYKTIYTNSTNINPANIGIELSGPLNIGSPLHLYRGFKQQVYAAKSSILRYYDIYSPGHSLATNLLKIKYTYTDMYFISPGYLNASALTIYASPNTDMNWTPLPSVTQYTMIAANSSTLNGEMTVNLSDLSLPNIGIPGEAFRLTIADPDCSNPPVSNLLLDTVHICIGNTLTLDAGNISSISNTSLKWEWNTVPAIYTRTLEVSPNSNYQKYKLKLMDVRGCVSLDSVIIAPEAPYPQITYLNHLNACYGDSILIKDTVKISTGSYSNYWQFSDSDTSSHSLQTFKKIFQTTGTHAYQLTATSNHGCSVTATSSNVIVYPLPTPGFTSSFDCLTHVMNFSNTSISNYSTLIVSGSSWNLGQGASNTSTLFSPAQSYSASGIYTVKLIAMSSFGCIDSMQTPITIYPTNQVSFSRNNSCLNDTTYFINTSSCNTGSCSYTYIFGDGSQSNSYSPKKVFASPGLFTTKLKVTNPFGCPDSISTSVFIHPNPNTNFTSSSNTLCPNELLYLTNTSSISVGNISGYLWDFGNTFTNTTTNAFTQYSIPGLYTVTLTAISDSGCVNSISLPIYVNAQPNAQHTVNANCFGSTSQFISSSSGNGLSYVWNLGNSILTSTLSNSTYTYSYNSAGNYSTQLIVFDIYGCSDTSFANAVVLASPTTAISGSISTCGTSYNLDAGNLGSSFLWQPGNQTSQSILTSTSGIYQVIITNSNNCTTSNTVHLTLNALVKPELGNDTVVCGPYILNSGYPGCTYQWNNASTSQAITAAISGSYAVQVTDINNCVGHDTIQLTILIPPLLSLGNDLILCKPKYGLVITPTTNAQSYVWNTGSIAPQLKISTNGLYWCEASSSNGCKNRDSILVNFLASPSVNIGNDREGCGEVLLDAQNYNCSYLWNTGSTLQTILAKSSSYYWVSVTNTVSGCLQNDTVNITIHPLIDVFLGNDTNVCANTNFYLNAQNFGANFNWTTGASTQTIAISSSGLYGVIVSNNGGCNASDYIYVSLTSAPIVSLPFDVQYLCANKPVELSVSNSGNVMWQSDNGLNLSNQLVSVTEPGKYWVTVNEFGCSGSDTLLILPTSNTIQASFLASTIDTINKPIKFVNLTSPLPTYSFWEFGDGLTSTESNPIHTYVLPKNYNISLEVSNGFCKDRQTKELNALFKLSENLYQAVDKLEITRFNLYPNPTNNLVSIEFELNDYADISLNLYDLSGKVILKQSKNSSDLFSHNIDLNTYANGVYLIFVEARSKKGILYKKELFIKTN